MAGDAPDPEQYFLVLTRDSITQDRCMARGQGLGEGQG